MKKVIGNIVSLKSGMILHQVNCQGVMGSGVAGVLRARYPKMFEDYAAVAGPAYTQKDAGRDLLGEVVITEIDSGLSIVSLFGQQFFGRDSKKYTSYDALDAALLKLSKIIEATPNLQTQEINHPLIGSGLGGGHWSIVAEIIQHRLGETTLWELPK